MKKLILLLFIPLMSFGQITLQEILAIDSENTFKRTMIENGFELTNADESVVTYDKTISTPSSMISANFRRGDSLSTESLYFIFTEDVFDKNDIWDNIYDEVKKNCEFNELRKYSSEKDNPNANDLAMYKCPDIDPDPRLVALQKIIKEDISDSDKTMDITDLEIGFVKWKGYYLIERPLPDVTADQMVELITLLMEYALEKQAKDSIQE
ncbi:hypothetical protein N9754_03000 [Flavobacteriaceae bacterium]|nr:hypothetical protein [Flavobacteriaceae bacterium]